VRAARVGSGNKSRLSPVYDLVALRRLAFALVLVAALVAAPARAQTPPVAPPLPGVPPRIATGVVVGVTAVGGMTEDEARAAIQAAFDERLRFSFRRRAWQVSPVALGSYPRLNDAMAAALVAPPGQRIRLDVKLHMGRIGRYVAHLDRVFGRPARDSRLLLRNLQPHITKARYGFLVRKTAMRNGIVRALVRHERAVIPLSVALLPPRLTRTSFGPTIVIRRESRRLYLYRSTSFVRRFAIAVGMPAYPTPLGRWSVVMMERHPTWNPPNSPWAAGLGPVPPGPANPLGTRWIGLSAPGIGIHGTPQPWTVGTRASHGCIRMYMREVEWLFERVDFGTTVFVVRA
jgi:lipoprotein-anchoring transpeptidase ErfK/SrfK